MQPVKRKWTRSPEREAQYEKERRAIVKAAYRLIGAGRESVSVQDILDEAGLSTRAFYRHFAGKDELILAMFRTDNERVAASQWAVTGAEADPWAALQAWVDLSFSVVFEKRRESHARVLNSNEARSAPGWSQEFLDGVERSIASLVATIVRGVEEGRFVTDTPRADAEVIFGATQNFNALRMAGSPEVTREDVLDAVLSAAARMLRVAPADR